MLYLLSFSRSVAEKAECKSFGHTEENTAHRINDADKQQSRSGRRPCLSADKDRFVSHCQDRMRKSKSCRDDMMAAIFIRPGHCFINVSIKRLKVVG